MSRQFSYLDRFKVDIVFQKKRCIEPYTSLNYFRKTIIDNVNIDIMNLKPRRQDY